MLTALMTVAIVALAPKPWRAVVGVVMACVITLQVGREFVVAVHTEELTGNPQWNQWLEEQSEKDRQSIRGRVIAALRAADDRSMHAAGWLDSHPTLTPFLDGLDEPLQMRRLVAVRALPFAWISGLHRCEYQSIALWYPGGPIAEAAGSIMWRERADAQSAGRSVGQQR